MTSRSNSIFEVLVTGKGSDHRGTRQVLARAATENAAIHRAVEVIKAWADAHGATQPGTTVTVIDMRDGGPVFQAAYLGHEPNLLPERH